MTYSVPDICDEFHADIKVVEPRFKGFGRKRKFCGEVITIKCYEDNSRVKEILAREGRGRVIVVDGGGSLRCALLGDMLAAMAVGNGWSGFLINGCVRDVEILETIDLGIQALNPHPAKSNKRNRGQLNVPVHFAGVTFRPGQYLYADENGAVIAKGKLDIDFL
jgi:regulator of ribonuclease activity A